MLRNDADQGITYNNINWAFHIKTLLDQLGFSNIWLDQDHLAGIPMSQIRQNSYMGPVNQNITWASQSLFRKNPFGHFLKSIFTIFNYLFQISAITFSIFITTIATSIYRRAVNE